MPSWSKDFGVLRGRAIKANATLKGHGEDVGDLPVFLAKGELNGQPCDFFISCWELSESERKEVAETGRIYVSLASLQPPLKVYTRMPEEIEPGMKRASA